MYRIGSSDFQEGYSFEEYLNNTAINKGVFEKYYSRDLLAGFNKEKEKAKQLIELLKQGPGCKMLAIVEDWCPDAYFTLGFWVRLVEYLEWEIRIFKRDSGPDMIAHFLKDGKAKSIPVYAFYTGEFEPLFWFSGRHAAGAQWKKDRLKGKDYDDLSPREKVLFRRALAVYYEESLFEATAIDLLEKLINCRNL